MTPTRTRGSRSTTRTAIRAAKPWIQRGGTSDAAPQWAALIAIADQGRALAGKAALDGATQTLPMLYALSAADFHDATSGTSTGRPRYSAGAGYDLVTGRGSPVANLVVSDLVGSSSTTTTTTATHFSITGAPNPDTAGQSFSITVTALDSSNNAVSGYLGTVQFSSSDGSAKLPANYTFTSANKGVASFSVTLVTAGSETLTVSDISNGSILGTVTLTVNSPVVAAGTTIEAFEGSSTYYIVGGTSATDYVSTVAKHDGNYGLVNTNGNDWIYRNDSAVQVKQGDTISVWLQMAGSADGRAYFGFGAGPSGTLSLVAAPNTGQLLIQNNAGYGFTTIGSVAFNWQANHWYRMEVAWGKSGAIIGKVYDSNGTTLLGTVNASTTLITSGGIAFRAIGSNKYWDTVQVTPGVNQFAQPAASTVAVSSAAGVPANGAAYAAMYLRELAWSFAADELSNSNDKLGTDLIGELAGVFVNRR